MTPEQRANVRLLASNWKKDSGRHDPLYGIGEVLDAAMDAVEAAEQRVVQAEGDLASVTAERDKFRTVAEAARRFVFCAHKPEDRRREEAALKKALEKVY